MTSYHEKLYLGRRGQICSIAKEDPLGIVHVVQPEGSYFWDGTKMYPLSHHKKERQNNLCIHSYFALWGRLLCTS